MGSGSGVEYINFKSNGGDQSAISGVCWNTSGTPTIYSNNREAGSDLGSKAIVLNELITAKDYYVRSYSINKNGTFYGKELTFKTKSKTAEVVTSSPQNVEPYSAELGGNVTSDGGADVSEKGICVNTTGNPDLHDRTIKIATGLGVFSTVVDSLKPNKDYYCRAYAINSSGIAYGEVQPFKTPSTTVSLSLNAIDNETTDGGEIHYAINDFGGIDATEVGLCYNKTGMLLRSIGMLPLIPALVIIIFQFPDFVPIPSYYVRIYAINTNGTVYSDELELKTISNPAKLTLTAPSSTTNQTISVYGQLINNGGSEITEYGFCLSQTGVPTVVDTKIIITEINGVYWHGVFEGLKPGSSYYVCAYVKNSSGYCYSNAGIYTTKPMNQTGTFTDPRDGNDYAWVKINNKIWMSDNLAYIPEIGGPSSISTVLVYGYIGNSIEEAKATENYRIYGCMYKWEEAKNACPTGWHLATTRDWDGLITYLGGSSVAGGFLKTTDYWNEPNVDATNNQGFNALPVGYVWNGKFNGLGVSGQYWGVNSSGNMDPSTVNLHHSSGEMGVNPVFDGVENLVGAIRCVKDYYLL